MREDVERVLSVMAANIMPWRRHRERPSTRAPGCFFSSEIPKRRSTCANYRDCPDVPIHRRAIFRQPAKSRSRRRRFAGNHSSWVRRSATLRLKGSNSGSSGLRTRYRRLPDAAAGWRAGPLFLIRGETVLLELLGDSWCPALVESARSSIVSSKQAAQAWIQVVAVSVDRGARQRVERYVRERRVRHLPMLRRPRGPTSLIPRKR